MVWAPSNGKLDSCSIVNDNGANCRTKPTFVDSGVPNAISDHTGKTPQLRFTTWHGVCRASDGKARWSVMSGFGRCSGSNINLSFFQHGWFLSTKVCANLFLANLSQWGRKLAMCWFNTWMARPAMASFSHPKPATGYQNFEVETPKRFVHSSHSASASFFFFFNDFSKALGIDWLEWNTTHQKPRKIFPANIPP